MSIFILYPPGNILLERLLYSNKEFHDSGIAKIFTILKILYPFFIYEISIL